MKKWIFIAPSSRGLGLHMTRLLLRKTSLPIVATARSTDLDRVRRKILSRSDAGGPNDTQEEDDKRLHLLRLDVTDEPSIEAAAQYCQDHFPVRGHGNGADRIEPHNLHFAFIGPGILPHPPEKSPSQIDLQRTRDIFAVNTIGPMLLFKHFSAFLPRRGSSSSSSSSSADPSSTINKHATAVWATLSARLGSIADNRSGGWYAYRASKAAVNSLTRSFDLHLQLTSAEKAMAVALHPGTVRTDLTGWFLEKDRKSVGSGGGSSGEQVSREGGAAASERKVFEPHEAVENLLDLMSEMRTDMRGRCWDWKGDEVPS